MAWPPRSHIELYTADALLDPYQRYKVLGDLGPTQRL
jgi:hypothetical protein